MNRGWTRRGFLQSAIAALAGANLPRLAGAQDAAVGEPPALPERHLELHNTHTDETVSAVFRIGDDYQPPALEKLRHVLRDHRSGESHDMDVALYEQLADLAAAAQREPRYQVISGYRSPASNAKLAARPGSGVSEKSLHMQGRAIDVRLRGCSCADLRDFALAAKKGGVGYYERSDFVHLDTGRFRTWNG